MYNHTSHSKVIVTARRKQKAKYHMLVQTMSLVKLVNYELPEWCRKQHIVTLSYLLYSNILVQVNHHLPEKRKTRCEVKDMCAAEMNKIIMQVWRNIQNSIHMHTTAISNYFSTFHSTVEISILYRVALFWASRVLEVPFLFSKTMFGNCSWMAIKLNFQLNHQCSYNICIL